MLSTREPTLTSRLRPTLGLRGDHQEPPARESLRFETATNAKREFLDARSVANAAALLDHLPEPGCSIHGVIRGNYNYFDTIPAVLRLAAPATLAYLCFTTLGFSKRVAARTLALITAGEVRTVDVVVADFFAKVDTELVAGFRAALESRGSRLTAAESHAKIILMETTDGRYLVSEASANIRSCRAIEQFALTQNRGLFEFHRGWIGELFGTPQKA